MVALGIASWTLYKHNERLVTVPPELKQQIVGAFQTTLDTIQQDATAKIQATSEAIQKNADAKYDDSANEINKQMGQIVEVCTQIQHSRAEQTKQFVAMLKTQEESISQTIGHIKTQAEEQLAKQDSEILKRLTVLEDKILIVEKTTIQNNNLLANASNEASQKANAYLNAAKIAMNDNEEIAQLMFVSALRYSQDKTPILNEMIVWYEQLVQGTLEVGNTERAFSLLDSLVSICDSNITIGSINDMKGIPTIKDKLRAINEKIASYTKLQIEKQNSDLESYVQKIETLSSYNEAEKLLKELSAKTFEVSLHDKKDTIVANIIQKQSCLTTPEQPLMLPTINAETPWNSWLDNFIVRLKSNIPNSKKLEDIGTAAGILQIAKESQIDGIAERFTAIEEESRKIYLEYWCERVDRALGNSEPNINDVSSLLAESKNFLQGEREEFRNIIVELNKYITQATLDELDRNLEQQHKIEEEVSAETFLQVIGMTQSQYAQVLLQLNLLQKEYPSQFTSEINVVLQKIASLEQLARSIRSKLTVAEIKRGEEQRRKFVEWAMWQLELAKLYDKAGEDIAGTWGGTRSSPKAVEHYKDAWEALMIIHPGDLQSVDPALYQHYSELKGKIENHWTPTENELKSIHYRRITDF